MNYDYLHEVESVELHSPIRRPLSELPRLFRPLGFVVHDDVLSLDRDDKVPPWQHSSTVEIEVQRDSKEVFGFRAGEWDVVCFRYLFATLPYELTDRFIEVAVAASARLSLPMISNGRPVDEDALRQWFAQIREELLTETGEEPGSEGLAILIHSTYPRR